MFTRSNHARRGVLRRLLLVLAMMFAGFFSNRSFATDVCTAVPPNISGYTSESCDSVCAPVSFGAGVYHMVCDLSDSGTGSGKAVVVYNDDGNLCSDAYCAWGDTMSGNQFFCEFSTTDASLGDLIGVDLKGTAQADELFFWYGVSQVDHAYNLEDYSGYSYGLEFAGGMSAGAGDDEQQGSRSTSTDYIDVLGGDDGADHICTFDGDDSAHGDGHGDFICLGSGDDFGDGGIGADELSGEAGDDVLRGRGQDDIISDSLHPGGYDIDGGPNSDECDGHGGGGVVNCESGPGTASLTLTSAIPIFHRHNHLNLLTNV